MTTLVIDPQSSISNVLSKAPDGPLTLILKEGVWREKVFVNRPDVTLISEEGARIDNDDRHGIIRDGRGNCKTRKLPQNMNLYTIS